MLAREPFNIGRLTAQKENVDLRNKTAHQGAPVIYDEMEEVLYQWIVEQRQDGLRMFDLVWEGKIDSSVRSSTHTSP